MVVCKNCGGNEIEALVWIDLTTNEITDRCDEYNCNHCQAKVDVVVVDDDALSWIDDVEPLKEDDEENHINVNHKLPKRHAGPLSGEQDNESA